MNALELPEVAVPSWREVLDFEAELQTGSAWARAQPIRIRFGVSPTRYHWWLLDAIERPEALAYAPALVGRLLRLRDQRRAATAMRIPNPGLTPTAMPRLLGEHAGAVRPDPAQPTLDLARPHAKEVSTVDQLSFPGSAASAAALRQAAERASSAAGEVHKLLGMGAADQAADPEWKVRVDAAITSLAAARDEADEPVRFTAEDVRAIAGDPPGHANAFGARFNAAARRGQIRKVAYRLATRPTLHRHPISVWVGTGGGGPA